MRTWKIRLAALAVIANGGVAIGFLFPDTALATTCNPFFFCVPVCPGQGTLQFYCSEHIPPGCKYFGASCVTGVTACNGPPAGQANCYYQPN